MSLVSVEALILQTIVDGLEDCGLDPPGRVVRYHGLLPNFPCCKPQGGDGDRLSVSWEVGDAPGACARPQPWTLIVRWVTCWPLLDPTPGQPFNVDWVEVEATSGRIADYSECIQATLAREVCGFGPDRPEWFAAMLQPELGRVEPIRPNGGCAGTAWRIVTPVRAARSPAT